MLLAAGPAAFSHAPAKLKADKSLALQFLNRKEDVAYLFDYEDLAPELQSDPDIIRAAVRHFPEALDYQPVCH